MITNLNGFWKGRACCKEGLPIVISPDTCGTPMIRKCDCCCCWWWWYFPIKKIPEAGGRRGGQGREKQPDLGAFPCHSEGKRSGGTATWFPAGGGVMGAILPPPPPSLAPRVFALIDLPQVRHWADKQGHCFHTLLGTSRSNLFWTWMVDWIELS